MKSAVMRLQLNLILGEVNKIRITLIEINFLNIYSSLKYKNILTTLFNEIKVLKIVTG